MDDGRKVQCLRLSRLVVLSPLPSHRVSVMSTSGFYLIIIKSNLNLIDIDKIINKPISLLICLCVCVTNLQIINKTYIGSELRCQRQYLLVGLFQFASQSSYLMYIFLLRLHKKTVPIEVNRGRGQDIRKMIN